MLICFKSNLHYTRRITPKRVTSGGAQLRGSWATQLRRNVTAVASRWRHCADLTGPGIEPQTFRTESVRLATELTAGVLICLCSLKCFLEQSSIIIFTCSQFTNILTMGSTVQ